MSFHVTRVVAQSSALPSVSFTETVNADGSPLNETCIVRMNVQELSVELNMYRLRELKAMLAQAEKAMERQQEQMFMSSNFKLDF